MAKLHDEMKKSGDWLFRNRGSFPLLIIPFVLLALLDSEYLEQQFGAGVQTVWEVLCICISSFGLFLRCFTLGWIAEGTSGRNRVAQAAASLNTTGLYSVTRHPLYFANFFILLGFIMFTQVWWMVVIYALFFYLFYERIMMAEETFLEEKFGDTYREWAERTPTLLPNFKCWKAPSGRFSWKMVLRREYSTLFGIITGFVAIKFLAELIGEHEFDLRMHWFVLMALGGIVYVALRTVRRHTNWLAVKNRPGK